MDTREFNKMVAGWPTVRKQVGQMADGTPLYAEVHSLFGTAEEATDAA